MKRQGIGRDDGWAPRRQIGSPKAATSEMQPHSPSLNPQVGRPGVCEDREGAFRGSPGGGVPRAARLSAERLQELATVGVVLSCGSYPL